MPRREILAERGKKAVASLRPRLFERSRPAVVVALGLAWFLAHGLAARASAGAKGPAFSLASAAATQDGLTDLRGAWLFHPGDDPSWADPELSESGWVTLPVPCDWSHHGFPRKGFGWFRFRLEVPEVLAREALALSLGRIGDAAEVFVNGISIGREGSLDPPYRYSVFTPHAYVVPARLIRADRPNVVAVRIFSLGVFFSGPFAGRPVAGDASRVVGFVEAAAYPFHAVYTGILAVAIAMVVYHLTLFAKRPQRRDLLYFSLGVAAFLPSMLVGTEARTYLWRNDVTGLVVLAVGTGLSLMLLAKFYEHLFDFRNVWLSRIVVVSSVASGFFGLIYGFDDLDRLSLVWAIQSGPLLAGTFYIYFLFVGGIRRRLCDAWSLAIGQTIAFGFATHSCLLEMGIIQSAHFFLPYSFPTALCFVSAVMARRMGIIQKELEDLNRDLEGKVKSRTVDLDRANRDLEDLNRKLEQKVEGQVEEIGRMNRLKRFLAPQVVSSIVGEEGLALGVKRKYLTIFYAGLANFEDLSEGMEAEDVIDLIKPYHDTVTGIIFQYGGTIDRFFGTRVTGFLGDPLPVEHHEEKAVRMAIALREAVRELRRGWPPSRIPVELRVGIQSGYVTVGPIGCESRIEYTAIGQAATTAGLLETEADPGQILIGARTYEAVREIADADALQVSLREGQPTTSIFAVKGLRGEAARTPSGSPWEESPTLEAPAVREGKYLGPYRILEKIGEGGMGRVYKALDEALNRHVAVKVLSRELSRDSGFLDRFRKEARSLASLDSEHIVRIYFIAERDAVPFFAMEYVDGGSLRDRIRKKGRLASDEARRAARETAQGLEAAWKRGIVHRDVKPDNLLLTREGKLKITDFGLGKRLDGESHLTEAGVAMGTPLYISPEQGRGEKVDFRSDLYSLGVTLFHCLFGKPPFESDSFLGLVRKHCDEPVPDREGLGVEVPDDLWRVVLRMLAKKPDDRFGSYAELIDALAGSARAETVPLVARPPGTDS